MKIARNMIFRQPQLLISHGLMSCFATVTDPEVFLNAKPISATSGAPSGVSQFPIHFHQI